ncbi:MAG TPA: hypothetical protein VFW86_04940 [Candidatus Limnocylindrales bacterium]|nr:hypothetical protein [Candidatus Limnocylindrales bacterium]
MADRSEARRGALLADIERDATLERSDFLVRAGEQLDRFLAANLDRIRELGGLVLIDDDPDYLAVAPDGTFRSRARVFDDGRGEWISETEVVETAAELVELYNPADVLQAFIDAQSAEPFPSVSDGGAVGAGQPVEADEAGDGTAASDPYAGAADSWAAGQPDVPAVHDRASAATALYDLTLDFQERSQQAEAGLLEQFENAASGLLGELETLTIVEDDDEQLTLGIGGFRGRVIPEGETGWHDLPNADEVVRFYDPTDVFGDLAEAIADAYPEVDTEAEPEAAAATGDESDEDDESDDDADEDEDDEQDDDESDDSDEDDDDTGEAASPG